MQDRNSRRRKSNPEMPPLHWITFSIAVGFFTLLIGGWGAFTIAAQRFMIPRRHFGFHLQTVMHGTPAVLFGLALLCFAVSYLAYAGLRAADGWEYAADRITRYAAIVALLLAITAFALNAIR